MLPARLPPSRIEATYTWIAPTHDWLARIVERRARARMLEWAAVRDGEAVLEVGVGTGLSFEQVLKANPSGYAEGVDRTAAMLRRAQARADRTGHPRAVLRRGDAYALRAAPAQFDLVVCSYMFDLLPEEDFVPLLQGFFEVLRPGGRLVMANMTPGRRWPEHLWEGLYRLHPALLGGCRGVHVAPALPHAGFTNVRREVIVEWLFPSEVLYAERPAR